MWRLKCLVLICFIEPNRSNTWNVQSCQYLIWCWKIICCDEMCKIFVLLPQGWSKFQKFVGTVIHCVCECRRLEGVNIRDQRNLSLCGFRTSPLSYQRIVVSSEITTYIMNITLRCVIDQTMSNPLQIPPWTKQTQVAQTKQCYWNASSIALLCFQSEYPKLNCTHPLKRIQCRNYRYRINA